MTVTGSTGNMGDKVMGGMPPFFGGGFVSMRTTMLFIANSQEAVSAESPEDSRIY